MMQLDLLSPNFLMILPFQLMFRKVAGLEFVELN